jgi:hypothetical protein
MSNEKTDEPATNPPARTRKRFKYTVVCLGMILAIFAYHISRQLGVSWLPAVQAANFTYLAIFLIGFILDLIIFRSN